MSDKPEDAAAEIAQLKELQAAYDRSVATAAYWHSRYNDAEERYEEIYDALGAEYRRQQQARHDFVMRILNRPN